MTTIHPGYETLVQRVLPTLDGFQTDITVHDMERLSGYQGDFISSYRSTGTDIALFDLSHSAKWTYEDVEGSIKATHETALLFIKRNTSHLLILEDGSSKHITADTAERLLQQRYEKAMQFYEETFKKMNFDAMVYLISTYVEKGNRWKSYLKNDWEKSDCLPELRRIRNFFMEDLKKIKNDQVDEIKNILINSFMEGR